MSAVNSPNPAPQLQFFGKITANVTHELNNVLGLVDQTTGLVDDLIAAGKVGDPEVAAKLARLAERLHSHCRRGVEWVKRLNTFAHTVDEPHRQFDLKEVVENLTALCRRVAAMHKLELSWADSAESVPFMGNPFLVQSAVFQMLLAAMEQAPAGSVLTVRVGRGEEDTWAAVQWEKAPGQTFARGAPIETAAGEVQFNTGDGGAEFRLVLRRLGSP